MRRVLKPGGRIYFVEANRFCPIQGRGEKCFWPVDRARKFFESHGFKVEETVGWNPLPTLFFWLPLKVKMKLPRKLLLWFYPPGRLLQYVPGWYALLRFAGKFTFLWRYCRSYYLCAIKV
ncbi:MAG: hypothetical protein DRG82_16710 [Deltaproteobacteria bacterium]|nr:MAG: hypothetical protein DRG82_16710 [Deltaproteobacteria bacterium]